MINWLLLTRDEWSHYSTKKSDDSPQAALSKVKGKVRYSNSFLAQLLWFCRERNQDSPFRQMQRDCSTSSACRDRLRTRWLADHKMLLERTYGDLGRASSKKRLDFLGKLSRAQVASWSILSIYEGCTMMLRLPVMSENCPEFNMANTQKETGGSPLFIDNNIFGWLTGDTKLSSAILQYWVVITVCKTTRCHPTSISAYRAKGMITTLIYPTRRATWTGWRFRHWCSSRFKNRHFRISNRHTYRYQLYLLRLIYRRFLFVIGSNKTEADDG